MRLGWHAELRPLESLSEHTAFSFSWPSHHHYLGNSIAPLQTVMGQEGMGLAEPKPTEMAQGRGLGREALGRARMLSLCDCRLPRAALGTRDSLGFFLFVVNV